VEGTTVNEIFLGACTNGSFEDLEIAANILRGKKIDSSVRMLVTPASTDIYLQALRAGLLETFIECGAMVTHPGCSACFGGAGGILGNEEVLLSTANRNFKGRAGSGTSAIYLGSPAMVAASAITGKITDPRRYVA
jgi:3-isopropylmalate/(R)-2-methylmalate dehydratase large subunit